MNHLKFIPLGELCNFLNGGTPSKSIPTYFTGKIPWITGADISCRVVDTARSFITEEAVLNSATNLVDAGTVLLVTRTSVGKVAIAGVPLCFSQDITAITPNPDKLDQRFLVHFLESQEAYFKQYQRGATIKGITREVISQLEVPLPPIAEQRRIAAILDKADDLREKRRESIFKLNEFRTSLFLEIFGDIAANPMNWKVKKVGEVGKVQLGRQRAPKYQTGKFTHSYVRVANVYEDYIDTADVLSMDFDDNDFQQYRLEYGDILLNEGQSTELVGRPAMWREEIEDCCFQNTLVRFQANRDIVHPEYALALFLTYFRTGQFSKISSKTSNVAHLGAARFASMPFVLPPFELQKTYARRAEKIRQLKQAFELSIMKLERLFASLQQRAFNGELSFTNSSATITQPPLFKMK